MFLKPASRCLVIVTLLFSSAASIATSHARSWAFKGVSQTVDAEFVGMGNGAVVLRGPNGKSFEIPFANFSALDQKYLTALAKGEDPDAQDNSGKPITSAAGYKLKTVETLAGQSVNVPGGTEMHVTGKDDPVAGSTVNFTSSDGWLFFDNIPPSVVISKFLDRLRVENQRAAHGQNIRVVQYGNGSVVIPQSRDFPGCTLFENKGAAGQSMVLKCYTAYDGARLQKMKSAASSFVLKRGYMATFAQNEDGTGISRNYVAQDHDLVVDLPQELEDKVAFARVFPWRWTGKKGVAGAVWQKLGVAWFYDWNISTESSADIEYVPIAQNISWPNLEQDWKERGSLHLLGFNEPDHKDQSNLTVDQAIKGWPRLMASGLRLGSPAVSDGGLGWLYQFMEQADAANLRVDFVAVHYYRAIADPGDAKGAAAQFLNFIRDIHERTKRPIWITEWNNGANWTSAPDPNEKQQKEAIAAMIKMLDEAPFVERYSIYNWVEDCRHVLSKDGTPTPAGEVYRDKISPVGFVQPKVQK